MPLTQSPIARADASGSFVADARSRLSYGTLATQVERFQSRLRRDGAHESRRCICLPLSNDIPSMISLLALLQERQSCALVPAGLDADPECPPFADTLLVPTHGPYGGSGDATDFRLQPIPGREAAAPGAGLVYLRTSGSTGKPKWVAHRVESLLANADACVSRLDMRIEDAVLIPVPIHHMYGLGAGLLPSLKVGASVILVPRGNPLEIFSRERELDPTLAYLVPSQCRSLLALRRSHRPYRHIVVAGDRLPPEQASSFETLHGKVEGLYGTTELGAIAAGSPDDPAAFRHTYVGTLLPGVSACGGDSSVAPPADEILDLCFRNSAGFAGYADNFGQIAQAAPACWCTRDLGRFDPSGHLQVLGRADHAVKRDGLLVHFTEVEACLTQTQGVAQAVVVHSGQSRRGAGLTAFCVLSHPSAWTPESLRRHCLALMPPRSVPDRILLVPAIPLLESGKLDRRALASQAQSTTGA